MVLFLYDQYRDQDKSITTPAVQRLVPLSIGIGKFWFDTGDRVYGSLISSLRTDGVEVTELDAVPDRRIAQSLRYLAPDAHDQYKLVPLPNHRRCLVQTLDAVEARELNVWNHLMTSAAVDVVILGEMTSEPNELRLWIGGEEGPRSVLLPYSTKKEKAQVADRVKIALLTAMARVAEDRLNLEPNYKGHVERVLEALKTINHTLTWRGLGEQSRLAMKVTRARLHENLLVHQYNVPTRDIEESYWALKYSNETEAPCKSISVAYDSSEASLAWVLTRRTRNDVWEQRAIAALEGISKKARGEGQPEIAVVSEITISRLGIERGMRDNDAVVIADGLKELEVWYGKLPELNSPLLWVKLPDTMITLYRQAAQVTNNPRYREREREISKCFPKLPGGSYERRLSGSETDRPVPCPGRRSLRMERFNEREP